MKLRQMPFRTSVIARGVGFGMALLLGAGGCKESPRTPAAAVDRQSALPRSSGVPPRHAGVNGVTRFNGLNSLNALNGLNGLNGPPLQDLIAGSLSTKSLNAGSVAAWLRGSAAARYYMNYIVRCALPEGRSITLDHNGETQTYKGGSGYAPQWEFAPCDTTCQEWITSCMLANTNTYAINVLVNWRAPNHPTMVDKIDDKWLSPLQVEEGAFFGNMFINPPRTYSCRGRDFDRFSSTWRVCTTPYNDCGIQPVGACGDLDGWTGQPNVSPACDVRDDKTGSYTSCHTRPGVDDKGKPHAGDQVYKHVTTVYIARTHVFAPPKPPATVACAPATGTLPKPMPAGDGQAGSACSLDVHCLPSQFCMTSSAHGFCTGSCKDGNKASEEAQCGGPGSTCVTSGDGEFAVSLCRRACDVNAAIGELGACPPHQVCTGFWNTHSNWTPDTPGCHNTCSKDADCLPGRHCNPYNGVCWRDPPDETKKKNGEPCELFVKGKTDATDPCRGFCMPIIGDPFKRGICASAINLAVVAACPDPPSKYRRHPNDNLALCVYRGCETDADCTAPHECMAGIPQEPGKVCAYPPI